MERAERSGGLHKRSAEDWGHGLRARGAELPLEGLALLLGWALRAGTARRGGWRMTGEAGRRQGGYFLPLQGFDEKKVNPLDQTDDRRSRTRFGKLSVSKSIFSDLY